MEYIYIRKAEVGSRRKGAIEWGGAMGGSEGDKGVGTKYKATYM